jgi:hypothetical protein
LGFVELGEAGYAVPTGRPASDNCRSAFAKTPSLLRRSSVHHPLVGTGRQTRTYFTASRPLFGTAVSVQHGWIPVSMVPRIFAAYSNACCASEQQAARDQQPDRALHRDDHWPPIQAPTLPITAMTATSRTPRSKSGTIGGGGRDVGAAAGGIWGVCQPRSVRLCADLYYVFFEGVSRSWPRAACRRYWGAPPRALVAVARLPLFGNFPNSAMFSRLID